MQIITNLPYPNRIQWVLENYTGPFSQDGPLGSFDPRRDLEVYVDGLLTPVHSFVFDTANNRYLLYMSRNINLQGVIQVVHHMPNPPFHALYAPPSLGFGQNFGVLFGS
jgi:hypothetical protein